MNVNQWSVTQRVVISMAVPASVLALLWPVVWEQRLPASFVGNHETFTVPVLLREQPWFWAAAIVGVAAWLCILWPRQKEA